MIYYRNRQTMTSPSGISCHVGDKLAPFPSDSVIPIWQWHKLSSSEVNENLVYN